MPVPAPAWALEVWVATLLAIGCQVEMRRRKLQGELFLGEVEAWRHVSRRSVSWLHLWATSIDSLWNRLL